MVDLRFFGGMTLEETAVLFRFETSCSCQVFATVDAAPDLS